MNGPRDDHTKQSKSERERQIPYDITYRWNLKYGTNGLTYQTETDLQTERTDLCHPISEAKQGWAWLALGSENRLVGAKGGD